MTVEVDMLDFEEVKFEGDKVECFMDLQIGKYPDSESIHEEAVKIGKWCMVVWRILSMLYFGSLIPLIFRI